MTQPEDRLRELFTANEEPIPDVTRVYVGSLARARVQRRRRRAAQIAGGAVVTAGIAVGAVGLSSSLTPTRHATAISVAGQPGAGAPPAAGAASPASTTSASPVPDPSVTPVPKADNDHPTPVEREDVDAFLGAGYTYDDAVTLAKTWNDSVPYTAKIQGGQKLRAGESLPIAPGSTPMPAVTAAPSAENPHEAEDVTAFFNAGYTYADASKLAKLWGGSSPYQAKVSGGAALLAGKPLPIQP